MRAAAGGSEDLRAIYEEARSALTDRIFREDSLGDHLPDDAGHPARGPRLVGPGRGDGAHLGGDPAVMSREALVDTLVGALPALTGVVSGDRPG